MIWHKKPGSMFLAHNTPSQCVMSVLLCFHGSALQPQLFIIYNSENYIYIFFNTQLASGGDKQLTMGLSGRMNSGVRVDTCMHAEDNLKVENRENAENNSRGKVFNPGTWLAH